MNEYFPEPKPLRGNVKLELESSNCVIKAHLENGTGADTSKFAKKSDFTNLKADVDK